MYFGLHDQVTFGKTLNSDFRILFKIEWRFYDSFLDVKNFFISISWEAIWLSLFNGV